MFNKHTYGVDRCTKQRQYECFSLRSTISAMSHISLFSWSGHMFLAVLTEKVCRWVKSNLSFISGSWKITCPQRTPGCRCILWTTTTNFENRIVIAPCCDALFYLVQPLWMLSQGNNPCMVSPNLKSTYGRTCISDRTSCDTSISVLRHCEPVMSGKCHDPAQQFY